MKGTRHISNLLFSILRFVVIVDDNWIDWFGWFECSRFIETTEELIKVCHYLESLPSKLPMEFRIFFSIFRRNCNCATDCYSNHAVSINNIKCVQMSIHFSIFDWHEVGRSEWTGCRTQWTHTRMSHFYRNKTQWRRFKYENQIFYFRESCMPICCCQTTTIVITVLANVNLNK